MSYTEFIERKQRSAVRVGFEPPPLHDRLFDFQRALVEWSIRSGRSAIFADTGLGKTAMSVEWAQAVHDQTGGPVLILAPLAVAAQTSAEAERWGRRVVVAREQSECEAISITNYDRLHRFDPGHFAAIVLDESSIIKHHDARTLSVLLDAFRETPYKLCCTATPAPNDWTELGTHAEFLGVCSRAEMLSEFFIHDGGETQKWRLKGHARESFWKWVASWGALLRSPADLGYDGSRYELPPVKLHERTIAASRETTTQAGLLFAAEASSLMDRRRARKASIGDRVAACVATIATEPDEPWIVWCDLNAESEALAKSIPGAVEIRGSDKLEAKEARLIAFARGEARVLVSKPSICGFGLNWQHCARVAFVGVTDSWEAYYQAVRRCWRFGQSREVHVYIFASEAEGAVVRNLRRKEAAAAELADELANETSAAIRASIQGGARLQQDYRPEADMEVPAWLEH